MNQSLIKQIKDYIKKIWNWIKEKFYKFLKIESVSINSLLYHDCIKVLDMLRSKLGSVIESEREEDIEKFPSLMDEIKESREYQKISGGYNFYSKSEGTEVIKTESLKHQVQYIQLKLKSLDETTTSDNASAAKHAKNLTEYLNTQLFILTKIISSKHD